MKKTSFWHNLLRGMIYLLVCKGIFWLMPFQDAIVLISAIVICNLDLINEKK